MNNPTTIYELIDQIYMEERMDEAEILDSYDNPLDCYCHKCYHLIDECICKEKAK